MPIDLGLQRISRLLAGTPLPWRAIHVAGTNGKGSICAHASVMLDAYNKSKHRSESGQTLLKHARFNSPHLIDRWDCIVINQNPVPFKLFDHMEKKFLRLNEQEGIGASEFEILTATAFEIFTHEEIDIGVIEVGIGGRLDATNIIGEPVEGSLPHNITPSGFRPPPLVTAISKIGLDHQGFLGSTLEAITEEKVGIIKAGVPVVYDMSNPGNVISVIETKARDMGCGVVKLTDSEFPALDANISQAIFKEEVPVPSVLQSENLANVYPGHQRRNLSVAFRSTWTALQELDRVPGPRTSSSDNTGGLVSDLATHMILEAAFTKSYPGRLQLLNIRKLTGQDCEVLLDGAHNAQSAEVLAADVERRRDGRGVTWILAFSDTKDISEILARLLRAGDNIVAVEFGPVDGMPWVKAMSAEKVVDVARQTCADIRSLRAYGDDIVCALKAAHDMVDGPLVIAGSLYLVGDVLRMMRDA